MNAKTIRQFVVVSWIVAGVALAQTEFPAELRNGNMEQTDQAGTGPAQWRFNSASGGTLSLDAATPSQGTQAALVDATQPKPAAGKLFANLSQTIDAKPWRGKRIRFRAAVRTAELRGEATAQLWLRIDAKANEKGIPTFVGFDNMDDRPIRDAEWKHYEIVLDVDEKAERMVCGMFVLGAGKAWLDDATLEEVDASVPVTGARPKVPTPPLEPASAKAAQEADNAPQQPFFTAWLWLPIVAMIAFGFGMFPVANRIGETAAQERPEGHWLWKIAFRFTVCYWTLYCLPHPFTDALYGIGRLAAPLSIGKAPNPLSTAMFHWGGQLSSIHNSRFEIPLVDATARHIFGVAEELVRPRGSGDTTHNYIAILNWFALAIVGALIWSLVDIRRSTNYAFTRDLLRSYLRYVLAFALLGYGLAKFSLGTNQFPPLGPYQLDKTWGDSSPMNVLWAFMGASRGYTVFAGLGEIVAALLLIGRRTSTLGALTAIGVMTNVAMLNFCYDVPVKIYSSHLLFMGVMLAIADGPRLLNLLVLNRPAAKDDTPQFWSHGETGKWIRMATKSLVFAACFAWPVAQQTRTLLKEAREMANAPQADGAEARHRLINRGFRWINEVPYNR